MVRLWGPGTSSGTQASGAADPVVHHRSEPSGRQGARPPGGSPRAPRTLERRRAPRLTPLTVLVGAVVLAAVGVGGWALAAQSSGGTGGSSAGASAGGGSGGGGGSGSGSAGGVVGGGAVSVDRAPVLALPGGAAPRVAGFNGVWCSSSTCLAVGAAADGAGTVAQSTSGGASWSAVAVPASTSALGAVACATGQDCVAVGSDVVLQSTDGGSSWSAVADPEPDADLVSVACPTATLCVAVGATANPDHDMSGAAVVSTDGGVTWSAANPVGYADQPLDSVSCPSSSTCVAVGAVIDVSADGGSSWQVRTVPGGIQSLSSVACSSATQCVAVGPSPSAAVDPDAVAVAVATSGGLGGWASLALPAGSGSADAVACPSSSSCQVVGAGQSGGAGPVDLVSSDGGSTWVSVSPPSGLSGAAGLWCPSSSAGCVTAGRSTSGPAAAGQSAGQGGWSPPAAAGVSAVGRQAS